MLQATFGPTVGMEPFVPIAPSPNDMVDCEDTGAWKRRADCLEAVDGTFWEDEEERAEREEYLVKELFDNIIEWSDDYHTSDDCVGEYGYIIHENIEAMTESVREALENCIDNPDGLTDETVNDVVGELLLCIDHDVTHGCYGSSNLDVVFDSFDCGEVEEEVDISNHPILKALNDRGDLEDILDIMYREFCLYRRSSPIIVDGVVTGYKEGPYVADGYITLYNNTDLWYWFGCSEEVLLEAYNNLE